MKKILLLALPILIILFLLKANYSFAQTQSAQIRDLDEVTAEYEARSNSNSIDLGVNPDVPKNLTTYTQSIFIEMTSAASCLLSGVDPIRPDQPCLGFDPKTKKLGYVENNGGALGLMGGLISSTFDIPASSSHYTRYLASNFGITKNAQAAIVSDDFCQENPSLCDDTTNTWGLGTGNGFGGLTPLLGIWTAMRNLVYLLFVLVFIVLGLGVMFRIQIDPRAVLSIQNQLPKVVIALVLVTFSYAIAGFLVDMMYLSLFLIINIFQAQGLDVSTSLATNPLNAVDGIGGIGGIAFDSSKGIASVMTSIFDGTFGGFFKGIINTVFGIFSGAGAVGGGIGAAIGAFGGPVGIVVGGLIGGAVGGLATQFGLTPGPEPFTIVVGAIAWLIILIALLSALFRLWFVLLKTYVFILIDITFAPIWIAFGLFPGSTLSFGNWIRSLVSNLAAFPVVLVLFSLGKTLQDGFANSGPTAFVPPYIGDPGNMSIFGSLIGMGMILLAPEAVNIAKSALKSPEFKLASAAFRPLGVGQGVVGKTVGSAKNALWYTNPHTGEAGRLKAFAGEKASEYLDKTPGIGKAKKYFAKRFESKKSKEARARSDAEKEAQTQRDATLVSTLQDLSSRMPGPPPAGTPEPVSPETATAPEEPPSPEEPDRSGGSS